MHNIQNINVKNSAKIKNMNSTLIKIIQTKEIFNSLNNKNKYRDEINNNKMHLLNVYNKEQNLKIY